MAPATMEPRMELVESSDLSEPSTLKVMQPTRLIWSMMNDRGEWMMAWRIGRSKDLHDYL